MSVKIDFSRRKKIKSLLHYEESVLDSYTEICGWIRTLRDQKSFAFIEVNDGSSLANLQVVASSNLPLYQELLPLLKVGAAIRVKGKVVPSLGGKQKIELQAEDILLVGECDVTYPLQKKRHSFEFLRTIAHLRPRTNTQGSIARLRSRLSFATHKFFQDRGFIYLQSPIITGSDCEGGGALFQVTTLNIDQPPKKEDGKVDYAKDFFSKPTYLTVSGQLNAETYACALSDVYTFCPTFRAENSHTSRHLAEFWMIEPEVAFANLETVKVLAEDFIKTLIEDTLKNSYEDLQLFNEFMEQGLIERLKNVLSSHFITLSYTEAIKLLGKATRSFEYPIKWGSDLQAEHERYLSEEIFKGPIILTDYPKEIKAFYMRDNEDGKTVAAMDLIVPKIGEIIGGSQREERLEFLKNKLQHHGLNPEHYNWYLDLRRYGSVPHAGFGAGFERIIQFMTGVENIRDVIAFPRVPGQADF